MWLNRNFFMLVSAASGTATVLSCIILGSTFISPFKLNGVIHSAYSTSAFNYTGVEQKTRAFLETLREQGGPPIYTLSPQEARAVLSKLQAATSVAKLPADIENRTIPGGPNGNISINIVRPQGSNDTLLPVVMYFHGGGWVLGGSNTHERLVRELANKANVAVVFVDYTPSPQAKYPVPIEEAYAATKWVAENGKSINVDSSRLAVAGDSVGGNMAAAVTLLAKERRGPNIAFQALFYPVTDANFDTPSYLAYQEGYWLTRKAIEWFWDNYAPDNATRKEPTALPLLASVDQLRGLPPALVITDEFDVLCDEGEAYAHKLMQANVTVTATRYLVLSTTL
jgi:acetyl esterase